MSDFGQRLRELREQAGLDQAAFGAIAGVSRNTQSKYESGSRSPDSDYLTKLRDSGIDIFYILTGRIVLDSLNVDETKLITAYREMPDWRRVGLLEFLVPDPNRPKPKPKPMQ